jgi:ATP-dependent DNA ligase
MAELPKPFPPMLLSEVKRPFHKPGWVYEEKYDGYRAVVYKDRSGARIVSRNLKDLTGQFEEVAAAVARLRAPSLIWTARSRCSTSTSSPTSATCAPPATASGC